MFTYRCSVRKVIDGDTVDCDIDLGFGIWLRNERVRLLGVDTPESRTRDRVEKVYGKAAKARLKELLAMGTVSIRTEKDGRGKFGRVLGVFFVTDDNSSYPSVININERLIKEHHAVRYHGQAKAVIEAQHKANRLLLKLHDDAS